LKPTRSGVLSLVFLPATTSFAASGEVSRYDLRAGDRLVYRQRVERTVESPRVRFSTRAQWTNQVLVIAERAGGYRVGFQRNRVKAELLEYRQEGRDSLVRERPAFEERMAKRPTVFAEANWILPGGAAQLPWAAVREAASEVLPFLHEVEPLPAKPLVLGAAWERFDELGLSLKVTAIEKIEDIAPLEDEECLRLEGADASRSLSLRSWFCPARGTMARLELTGTYPSPPDRRVGEQVSLELLERQRGEELGRWLAGPDTRRGVLAALLASESPLPGPVSAEGLWPLLETDDAALARQVLAVAHRHRLAAPSIPRLEALLSSPDPRLRVLVVRNLEGMTTSAARPLVERALADADAFVQGAAVQWVASRRATGALPRTSSSAQEVLPTLAEKPWRFLQGMGALTALTRARSGDTAPDWNCHDMPDWPERAMAVQLRAGHVPGATLRRMTTPPFTGRPYVLHVPEDYRGDEPFPLLVVLAGGPGRAIPTAQFTEDTLEPTGYLAAYPEARGMWWDESPAAAVRALISELLRTLDVDPNRVYLNGFSNGGSATYLYATRWTDRLAAASSLMGAGIHLVPDGAAMAANVAHLPFLFVHGDADQIIPVRATLATVKAIRRANPDAPVEERVLKGREHDVTLSNDGGFTLPFLEDRGRDPFPRRVSLRTRSTDEGRRYWVAVEAKDDGMAEVDAEIGEDNEIRVRTKRVRRLRLLLRREIVAGPKPVRVVWNGREVFTGPLGEDCALLARSWGEAADPFLAYSAELAFDVPK
jgi:dienelactone hydrolase